MRYDIFRMDTQRPYKRKQLLVDPAYQYRFVVKVFLAVFMVAAVSSLLATGLIWKNLYRPELEVQTTLISSLIAVATIFFIELLLAIPIVYILGIRQSHRIVGPMKRMQQTLLAIGAGNFSQRIVLREGDALEDLAKAINEMAEQLQRRYPS